MILDDLKQDEGFKPYVYDDANGKAVIPGYTLIGHPTIGYGWALDITPCDEELGEYILNHQVLDKSTELNKALPWLVSKSQDIQDALLDMAFNLGVKKLTGFYVFINLIQQGKYSEAADDLSTTLWYKQVGARAVRIQGMIRNAI